MPNFRSFARQGSPRRLAQALFQDGVERALTCKPLTRSRPNVFRHPTAFALNEALQLTMLLAQSKLRPDFGAASLDEVLAVRVLVDHELMTRSSVMPRPCLSISR